MIHLTPVELGSDVIILVLATWIWRQADLVDRIPFARTLIGSKAMRALAIFDVLVVIASAIAVLVQRFIN